jgi:hypothetical protein
MQFRFIEFFMNISPDLHFRSPVDLIFSNRNRSVTLERGGTRNIRSPGN